MTSPDLIALLPLLVLAGTALVVMMAIAFRRSHRLTAGLALTGLAAALVTLWPASLVAPRQVTPLLIVDPYALFYTGLILAAALAVVLLSYGYLEKQDVRREEFYVLLLLATLGSAVLAASGHFASLFLGLELLSVPLYVLIAYPQTRPLPLEAGLKYLVLAAASAAFLVFGMALIYFELGTMEFPRMAELLARTGWLTLPGLALMITGFGFKLAVVPFHLWTPDVYEGAPAPVTAFIATVSKGGVFALLIRYFYILGAPESGPIFTLFTIIAIASMFAGNLLALLQNNVKRILAYSSIAHLGYVLVAFQAGGGLAVEAVTYYLVAYFVTILGAFGVVTALSDSGREAAALDDYHGLFWRRPWLAGIFTAMLLSLAGIPLTAGFLGKFYVLAAGAASAIWLLAIVLVLTSAIGVYYYLRVIVTMYSRDAAPALLPRVSPASGVTLVALALLLIWLGTAPGPMVDLIRAAAR